MSRISRNLNGPYAMGVPNPYTAHVHPYPTRYHGAIYTRPEFGLPYVRNPHTVFKPDDFYSYYGVSGLGSFQHSTMHHNSLGLGATGTPIYYLASKPNTKVSTLQAALNKILTEQRYRIIPVTGKLDALTCAALTLCDVKFKEDLLTQAPSEIISEANRICNIAAKNAPIIRTQVKKYLDEFESNRDPLPPEPLTSPTEVVPASGQLVSAPGETTPPNVVPPLVQNSVPIEPIEMVPEEIPEVTIMARPPVQQASSTGLFIGVAAAALLGAYAWKKSK